MLLDVFGKLVEVNYTRNRWCVFYLGSEGKKRLATDIQIPNDITAVNVRKYIADLCHERATPANPAVVVLRQ
ncbi:MAG: hypothetical protein HWE26_06950 [Alteromonadaceae bacterium]|nr:hypothetical protein [Alteromonadaceae bacterium]